MLHTRFLFSYADLLTMLVGLALVLLVSGCETAKLIDKTIAGTINPAPAPPAPPTTETTTTNSTNYSGPRARLTVLRFTDATNGKWEYTDDIGEGMTRKLVSSIVETRRFLVLDRRKVQDSVKEIEFGRSGYVDKQTAAKLGRMAGAQLVVTAVVTDFDEKIGTSSRSRSMPGIPGGLQVTPNTNSAYMAVNIEVIDVETSEVVVSKQVEGKITDVTVVIDNGHTGLGDVGTWDKYPRGKALQKVIDSASSFLAKEIPNRYFTEQSTERKPVAAHEITGKAQRVLKDLGYYKGKLDGRAGPQFSEAIKKFQRDHGLSVTGEIDSLTREKLLSLAE